MKSNFASKIIFSKNILFAALLLFCTGAMAAQNAGYIKSITYTTGKNGINYAVIGTSSPQQVSGTQNYVGAESYGLYTLIVLPSDPSLMAVAASTLERCRGNTNALFFFQDVKVGPNSALAEVPIRSGDSWVNLITTWWVGQ